VKIRIGALSGVVALAMLAATASAVAQARDRGAWPGRHPGHGHVGPASHAITWDPYSLMIDGRRTFIWSGEFEYWRLPSPDLWPDVLQKMKAEGYNAVTVYFNWAYHSPAPGVYDFSGVRDVNRLLDDAERAGLYVIARPGPYINAETSGGGFPGWLTTQAGRARTDAPDYLAAADDWLHHIDAILARHQLTNGTGTVIAEQIENELGATGTAQRNYMQNLADTVHGDGMTVPIFHNAASRSGVWVPPSSDVPGTVQGPVDLYAWDAYPGGTCSTSGSVGSPSNVYDWGLYSAGGARGGDTASPQTPGFTAEFGGGWFDYWGSVGTYPCTAQRQGPGYERVQYGANIANGIPIESFYMTFGGTSWGWLPAPVVYTSYDYGAAIDEARQLRPKATTMKELGLFLQSAEPVVTKLDKGPAVTASNSRVRIYSDVNTDLGAHLYVAIHDPGSATTDDDFTFTATTSDGTYRIPAAGTLAVNGQDAKILLADYDLGGQHLVYSTSQLMTQLAQDGRDLALLYAPRGEDGETVLRYASRPHVQVLSGSISSTYDDATGDLRLDYTHEGLAEVRVTGGGRRPLTLLLADEATAGTFWRQDTGAGPMLEQGPELVRTAATDRWALRLTGDTADATTLRVWAPERVHAITWNGRSASDRRERDGSVTTRLPGASPVHLPDLSQATWRTSLGSPELQPGFDDSDWQAADRMTTNSTTPPPDGQPVLTADDYGFHQGDVWYRGSYSGDDSATTVSLHYGGGGAGMMQAWLDGVYLGQDVLGTGVASPPTSGTVQFAIPANLRGGGRHELSVMVRDDSHNEDGGVNDAFKEGRGLIAVTFAGAGGDTVAVPVSWKIRGDLGGEDVPDTARGINNAGGLHGERHGWYLPGFPDRSWSRTTLPQVSAAPGTTWYRTRFRLDVPREDDASLGVTIGDPSVPQSDHHYRALIYVNGWNMGQYVADVGPQHTFVVPNGVLDPDGENTLAIAVTSQGGPGNGLEPVSLTDLGTVRGGVPVRMNRAPSYDPRVYGRPTRVERLSFDSLTTDAGNPVHADDTLHVTGTVTNRTRHTITGLSAALSLPDGWTAAPGQPAPSRLAPGESATLTWTVPVPHDVAGGSYAVAATAEAGSAATGAAISLTVRAAGDLYLSDLDWTSATNGYGPVERDMNVGGSGSGDGSPITIKGVAYAKGLGTNAISRVDYALDGRCTRFSADVGVDDSAGGRGSVTFSVLADGRQVAGTGRMTGGQAAVHLSADITGAQTLSLLVGDANDGIGHDNGDWGDAQIHCTA
jgi:beta-galactosidase GanA